MSARVWAVAVVVVTVMGALGSLPAAALPASALPASALPASALPVAGSLSPLPVPRVEVGLRRPGGGLVNADDELPVQVSGDGRLLLVESWVEGLVRGLDLSPGRGMQWPYLVDRVTGRVSMPLAKADGTVPVSQVGDPVQLRPVLARGGRWLLVGAPLVSMLPPWVGQKERPPRGQFFGLKDLQSGEFIAVRFPKVRVGAVTGRSYGFARQISHDGRYVRATVFGADNIGGPPTGVEGYTGGWRYDRVTGTWLEVVRTEDQVRHPAGVQAMSGDGRWMIGTNGVHRWMIDATTGRRVWTLPDHLESWFLFTGDSSRLIASSSQDPVGAYRALDVRTGRRLASVRLSKGIAALSVDWSGDRIAGLTNESDGTGNPYPAQFYLCRWSDGACVLTSRGRSGGPARGGTNAMYWNTLSFDGTVMAFSSGAPNLVAGDTAPRRDQAFSGHQDVFVATIPATSPSLS